MDSIKFGKWELFISTEKEKELSVVKDDHQLIIMEGSSTYLLYATLQEEDLLIKNVDTSVSITFPFEQKTITLTIKEEDW